MMDKQYDFTIIFKEFNKLTETSETTLKIDELKEYDEIRTLREIVFVIQTPVQNYLTST